MTYSTSRTYYRLSEVPRGKPAPRVRADNHALLYALFAALVMAAYVAVVSPI